MHAAMSSQPTSAVSDEPGGQSMGGGTAGQSTIGEAVAGIKTRHRPASPGACQAHCHNDLAALARRSRPMAPEALALVSGGTHRAILK